MKSVSTALKDHLAGETMSLATLWKVTRKDGQVFGFTTHDEDIVYDGVTYAASTGYTPSAIETKSDMSVGNMQITAFLDSDAITDNDIRANLYDDADVEIRVVNWADLTMGDLKLSKGSLGVISMSNGLLTAELRGLTQRLQQVVGNTYGPTCRAELFSDGITIGVGDHYLCRLNRGDYVQNGTVASCPDRSHIIPGAGLTTNYVGPNKGSATQTGTGFNWIDGFGGTGSSLAGQAFFFQQFTSGTGTTEALQLKGFGFTVDPTATVVGIKVAFTRWNQFTGDTIMDDTVQLLKAGTGAGANRANGTPWPYSVSQPGPIIYGGNSDLWGTTWTPSEINNAGFGVQIIGNVTASSGGFQGWIGFVGITVYLANSGGGGTPPPAPRGYFNNGILEFTSGIMNGYKFEVNFWSGTALLMYLPMPYFASPGDTFTIEPGCDKTLATCRDKFNNVVNRQAEDYIAGNLVVLNYPDAKAPVQTTA